MQFHQNIENTLLNIPNFLMCRINRLLYVSPPLISHSFIFRILWLLSDSFMLMRQFYPGNQEGENIIVGESRCFRIQKNPDVNLELGLFTDARMADVSAVFFNIRATFSKVRALAKEGNYPIIFVGARMVQLENLAGLKRFSETRPNYQETILDGLHILINPFAKHPLDLRMFEGREVAIHTYEPKTDSYLSKILHGFLLQRMCNSIISEDTTVEFKQSITEHPYQELSPEVWNEDELIHVGGQNGPFRDNHMAHYRGWKVVVSFCSIDKDWGTQAVYSLCYNIPRYMTANRDEDVASIGVPEWFSTKEDAYVAIKQKIDQITDQTGV